MQFQHSQSKWPCKQRLILQKYKFSQSIAPHFFSFRRTFTTPIDVSQPRNEAHSGLHENPFATKHHMQRVDIFRLIGKLVFRSIKPHIFHQCIGRPQRNLLEFSLTFEGMTPKPALSKDQCSAPSKLAVRKPAKPKERTEKTSNHVPRRKEVDNCPKRQTAVHKGSGFYNETPQCK